MKFIRLSLSAERSTIYVRADEIVAVYRNLPYSDAHQNGTWLCLRGAALHYVVTETPEQVMAAIEQAEGEG